MTAPPHPSPGSPPDAGRILPLIRDALEGVPEVVFAYLFGSVAKGRPREGSDVDVGVFLDPSRLDSPADRARRALDLEASMERALGHPVQVVPLNDAAPELVQNALRGRLAFSRDEGARVRFYVEHCRRYFDMAHARKIFDRYRDRRIREGTFGGGSGHGS